MSSEVLDQSEVDALLSAVQGGEVEVKQQETKRDKQIVPYDFKRPERVSKDQMRSIETMHEVFARNLSAALSGLLRSIVDISLTNVDQLTYSEFIMSLPNPTCFNLLSCDPLEGNMILELNHSIVFPILDRLLGGGKASSLPPERPLTDIEWRLVRTIIDKAVEQLKTSWTDVKSINFAITASESNPQLMQTVAPNEPVILISFEVTIGEVSGMMNLCIPFMVIEPIVPEIAIHGWATKKGAAHASFIPDITENISTAQLDVSCVVVQPSITVKDLLELEVGDEIMTAKLYNTPFLMYIQGEPKYWVRPGKYRGHKAIQVLDPAKPSDTV